MKEENDSEINLMNEKIKELVIIRIQAQMPANFRLCIGDEKGSLDMNQMIEHVKKEDPIGKAIIQSHWNFIKAQASGALISALNSV